MNNFASKCMEIRQEKISWQSYMQGNLIDQEHYQFIVRYDNASSSEARDAIIRANPPLVSKVFNFLLTKISKDRILQYILTMIDDMFMEDKTRVEIFQDSQVFFGFLARSDTFSMYQASRIITKIACWSSQLMKRNDVAYFITWMCNELKAPKNAFIETVARNIQMMLRIKNYREIFVANQGIESIVALLSDTISKQLQYQLIFCLWCLTFEAEVAARLCKTESLISTVADILRETERDKVIRIILLFFHYLLEKVESQKSLFRDTSLGMVHAKVLKQLEVLAQKELDDIELKEDLEYLLEKLSASVQDVSSLEEYRVELLSGRLDWTPVHKAEKFWLENAVRFTEKNYELLKMLVKLLEVSKDVTVLSVAAHDLGQFVRHYPRGKQVIEQLNGKQHVMRLLNHENENVRYHALISLQKIMVHNWEYLGRQVESAASSSSDSKSVKVN